MFFDLIFIGMALLIAVLLFVVMVQRRKDRDVAPGRPQHAPAPQTRKSWSKGTEEGPEKRNWLVGRTGSLTHRTYFIGQRTITIGRGVSNPIQVGNSKASRIHCRIETVSQGIHLLDLNSANGTLVNGEVVHEHFLKHGDEINVGDDIFIFHEHGKFTQDDTLSAKSLGNKASDTTKMVRPEMMPGFESSEDLEE